MLKKISASLKQCVSVAVLACSTALTLQATPALTRGPYLQNGSSTSITIHWRTDVPTDSKVTYGTSSSSLSGVVTNASSVTEHIVKITGLSPYTKYYYSVGSSSAVLQSGSQNYFLTAPASGQEGKYTFWINGDCGKNSTMQKNVRDAYLNYMGSNVTNGWLLLGDNAYMSGTDGEYSTGFFGVYQSTIMKNATLWPTPGNHDYANSYTHQNDHNVPYFSLFDLPKNGEAGGVASNSEAFYSYDYGNVHFLSLDSYGRENNSTRLYDTTGAQVQWIKQDLAANNKKWVVAYFHHPPYTMGTHNSDTETDLVRIRTNLIKILERMGVDLIVCGHSHNYERSKLMKGYYGNESSFTSAYNVSQSSGKYDGSVNSCTYLKDDQHKTGAVYIVAGSSGQVGSPEATYPHNAMHYSNTSDGGSMVLEVEGNRLDAKWLCADGVVRDKFTIIKDANKVRNISVNAGASVTMSASWLGQYDWENSSSSARSITFTPVRDTTCIVTDQFQCVADTFHITVNQPAAAATVNITSLNQAAKCAGAQFNIPFTASGTYASGNQFKLQLSNASGSFASPVTIGTLTATASGTIQGTLPSSMITGNYKVRIVSTSPVVTSAQTNSFKVNSGVPVVAVTSSDPNYAFCAGTPVTFTASGAETYQFMVNNVSQGAASATNTFTSSTLTNGQNVEIKGSNACGTTSVVKTMTVHALPNASLSGLNSNYFYSDQPVTLVGSPSGGTFSGPGMTGPTFSPGAAGVGGPYTITYSYTNTQGCTDAATSTVSVFLSTAIENSEESSGLGFNLFPNPTENVARLVVAMTESATVEVKLVDLAGRVHPLFSPTIMNEGDHVFEINKSDLGLRAGMYFVRINIGKQQKVLRLTFQ